MNWKKFFGGVEKGLAVGALFNPQVALILSGVAIAKKVMKDSPGADRKALVESIAEAELAEAKAAGLIDDADLVLIAAARSKVIDAVAAADKAKQAVIDTERAAEEAIDAMKKVFDAIKH